MVNQLVGLFQKAAAETTSPGIGESMWDLDWLSGI